MTTATMTVATARRILAEHEVPGAHAWSESIARGWDFEEAACDECEYARVIVKAADERLAAQRRDARFVGRNW